MQPVYPVILPVPENRQRMSGPEKVRFLSRHAREAVAASACDGGYPIGNLAKDSRGAPLPCDGIYWSVTHKPMYVAGVVAPYPVGIDIEMIRPCSDALRRKVADESEWELSAADPDYLFFRYWTAKEVVLKAAGTGLVELSGCRIHRVEDDRHLTVRFRKQDWEIEHFRFDGHIASILVGTGPTRWRLMVPAERISAPGADD